MSSDAEIAEAFRQCNGVLKLFIESATEDSSAQFEKGAHPDYLVVDVVSHPADSGHTRTVKQRLLDAFGVKSRQPHRAKTEESTQTTGSHSSVLGAAKLEELFDELSQRLKIPQASIASALTQLAGWLRFPCRCATDSRFRREQLYRTV